MRGLWKSQRSGAEIERLHVSGHSPESKVLMYRSTHLPFDSFEGKSANFGPREIGIAVGHCRLGPFSPSLPASAAKLRLRTALSIVRVADRWAYFRNPAGGGEGGSNAAPS
jgi:hypothetical protein